MSRLQTNGIRRASAALLALFFFSSQAFSCCLFNQRVRDYLESSLSRMLPGTPEKAGHACCPAKQAAKSAHDGHGNAEPSGCCILEASSDFPQLAGEGLAPPVFPVTLVSHPSPARLRPMRLYGAFPIASRSDPPLYLTHRSLLI